jgi:hypothetical protein
LELFDGLGRIAVDGLNGREQTGRFLSFLLAALITPMGSAASKGF